MAIFGRRRTRDEPKNEWTLAAPPSWMFGARNASGADVNPHTAMQLSAVYACVRVLAEAVASLPLHLYRYKDGGAKEKAVDDDLYFLLHDAPNPEMTSFIFRETMMTHLLLWGNAYAQIQRNGRGDIIGLYPLKPENVMPMRDEKSNAIFYKYRKTLTDVGPEGKMYETFVLRKDQVLHIPGLGFNGLFGYSPIALARNAVGTALSAEEFGGKFFANGSMPSGIIEYPNTIKDIEGFRAKWEIAFAGAKNAGKTPILEDGMKYTPLSVTPQDAQFLETRKFQIDEIARIFRVPPHMVGDLEKSSFSNIEQQSLEFVKYTLAPWVTRWEQCLAQQLLFTDMRKRYFWKFSLDGLLRGDYQSRMNGYAIARQNGWMSANDIRELENLDMIPAEDGGDLYLVNGNMMPLANAGAAYKNDGKEDAADEEVLELDNDQGRNRARSSRADN